MTANFIALTTDYYVAPQLSAADVEAAAREGFKLVVNNRPDGEMVGQPPGADIEAAAKAAGMDYAHIPVGEQGITPGHIEALKSALDKVDHGKTLAFCRSGARSTFLMAYAAAVAGGAISDIVADAAAAGFDISGHVQVLESLKSKAQSETNRDDE